MKIYTEVNYKWIDGSLVQTFTESFDYTGDLTLCSGGGGGGGKGGGGSSFTFTPPDVSSVTSQIADTIGDVGSTVTTATGAVADLGETVADTGGAILETGIDAAGNIGDTASTAITENLEDVSNITTGLGDGLSELSENTVGAVGDLIGEGLTSGGEVLGEGLAMNEGFATTLSDTGNVIGNAMEPLASNLATGGGMLTDNIAGAFTFLGEKGQELTNFLHGPSSPSDVKLDKDKLAIKGAKKKKNKSDLAVNKAKTRSRKSLRV